MWPVVQLMPQEQDLVTSLVRSVAIEQNISTGSENGSLKGAKSTLSPWFIELRLALTPETNEHGAAFPKSHCYFASTYCLSLALLFRLLREIPKTPSVRLLRHDDSVKT